MKFVALYFTLMFGAILCIILGIFLNQLVFKANKSKMPVIAKNIEESDYITNSAPYKHFGFQQHEKKHIKFWFLSDIFEKKLFKYTLAFSIGDIFIVLAQLQAIIALSVTFID